MQPRRAKYLWCLAGTALLGLTACGSAGPRQDVSEPSGTFQVTVAKASFPKSQRVGATLDLRLAVRNTGSQTVPDLAITIFADPNADRPFSVRSSQMGLANPNRPIWVLQNDYPKLAGSQAPAGALTANRDTFQFGALAPGETREAIWRVSPVRGGTYTLNYRVDAGLEGKAHAVTASGSPVTGKLAVQISNPVPATGVDSKGRVITLGK